MKASKKSETARQVLQGHQRELAADRMRAVRDLGEAVALADDRAYQELDALAPELPPAEHRAAARYLLDARRNSVRWEILSRAPSGGDGRLRRDITEVGARLRDEDASVRLATVQGCFEEANFSAAPALATRLAVERDPVVRTALARALGYLGGAAALPVLKRASRDESVDVRLGALEGLGYQLGEDAVRLILERTIDPVSQVRRVARGLVATYDPDVVLGLLERIPDGRGSRLLRGGIRSVQAWLGDARVDRLVTRLASWSRPDVAQVGGRAIRTREEPEETQPPRPRPYLSLSGGGATRE